MIAVSQALVEALRLIEANRLDAAGELCRKIIAAAPANAEGAFLAGVVAQRRNQRDVAATFYRRAVALAPDYADAHNNLGNILLAKGKVDDAIECFRRTIALEPNLAAAHYNLANALAPLDSSAALASYRRALTLDPRHVDALNNIGSLLRRVGQPTAAVDYLRRALTLEPNFVAAHSNFANALVDLGHVGEALEHSRRAMMLAPDNQELHSAHIFDLNFDDRVDTREQQAERRHWAERHTDRLAPKSPPRPRDPDPNRRLRVGYVSAHFRAYAATYAFGGVLLNHDPAMFEVFCYSDTGAGDDLTSRFRARADHWRDTAGASDEAIVKMIRRDQIDVLVDLVGHQAGHRLLVFAHRSAPVQITGWGEPTGTGLKTMDYLLADPVLVPESERRFLTETVIDLPSALAFWTPEPLPDPGALPARERGYVTFGSFNRRAKVTAATLAAWVEILDAVPNARLVLKNKAYGDAVEADALRAAFTAAGIASERIIVKGQTGRLEHFLAYREIDIALDPFPHGGGMTTLDAIAMGVPVVTKPGRTISARLGASCLTALSINQLIAEDPKSYVALATALAQDMDRISALRRELPKRLANSIPGDPVRYTRAVENAYRSAWSRCCAVAKRDD